MQFTLKRSAGWVLGLALAGGSVAFAASPHHHHEDDGSITPIVSSAPVVDAAPAANSAPAVVHTASQLAGTYTLADPTQYSQIYVSSDAHGMYDNLIALLHGAKIIDRDQHWTAGKSLLIITGDSIDKGPKSVEVIDFWIALSAKAEAAGGKIVHLLGNHEAEFLSAPNDDHKAVELLKELSAKGISVKDFLNPKKPRGAFIQSMKAAARVGNWIFCHAGYFPEGTSWEDFSAQATTLLQSGSYGDPFFIDSGSFLEAKNWWKKRKNREAYLDRLSEIGIYGVVQGHQPSAFEVEGRIAMIDGGHFIKIDTGMAPEAGSHAGQILRFPAPRELGLPQSPTAQAISPDGTVEKLVSVDGLNYSKKMREDD